MTNYDQDPVEPGWNHKPGDPDDTERWWTGAEWSDYTRLSSTTATGDVADAVEGQSTESQSTEERSSGGDWGTRSDATTDDQGFDDRAGHQAAEDTGLEFGAAAADVSPMESGAESFAGFADGQSVAAGHDSSYDPGVAPPPPEGSPSPEYASSNAAAAASYDPSAGQFEGAPGQYDPNIAQYAGAAGQAGAQYDPNVAQYAGAAVQAGAPGQYDPNAGQYAPNPGQYDPNAVQFDPNTGQFIPMGGVPGAGANRTSSALAFVDRIFASADDGESGWNRNLATLAWIPGVGVISVIAYALSGSQMSRYARSHIVGAFNLALSVSILATFATSIFVASNASVVLGALWALVLTAALAGIVFVLSKRDADGLGPVPYWIWFGGWVLAALLTVLFVPGVAAFPILFGVPLLIVVVVNAVRGRVGKEVNFFGYPAIPILSQN